MGPGVEQWVRSAAFATAVAVLLSSSLHFWPLQGHRWWELLCPANTLVLLWLAFFGTASLLAWNHFGVQEFVPHVSLLGYVLISVLSVGFAPDLARSATVTAKLLLTCVGGYVLFGYGASTADGLRKLYLVAAVAVACCIGYCLVSRIVLRQDGFGFFQGPYKYGTYVGMLASLGGVTLVASRCRRMWVLGALLIVAGAVSMGSLGGMCAIGSGMAIAIVLTRQRSVRWRLTAVSAGAVLVSAMVWRTEIMAPLRDDVRLREADGTNCRQRYSDWQAMINLLEMRTVSGSGAGCSNTYKGHFYYRLPKLNTLKPFEQNGWLATAAESGLFGLMCLSWAALEYFAIARGSLKAKSAQAGKPKSEYALANCAGLAAAFVGNIFSSIRYNGVLIAFAAVLALTARERALHWERQVEK